MPILILDDVKPGMTLAQPVYTHQDRLLLETGHEMKRNAEVGLVTKPSGMTREPCRS